MRVKAFTIFWLLTFVLAVSIPLSEGNSSGRHNSGSSGCGCHGGAASSISATTNFPAEYDPSTSSYSITIGFSGGNGGSGGGFSLQVDKGSLSNPGSNMKISGTSATHSGSAGTSWTFQWTPPASGSGDVTVNLAVMNANRASGNNGDIWSKTVITIPELADVDTDGDGVSDGDDAFPNDPNEWDDTDGDGVGDNSDAFPNDPNESVDSDGDGVGDNSDWAPNDASESADTDGDGVGDNADAFPDDATETLDSDGDGVGDNTDIFPNDATETLDTDSDGVGDNADAFDDDPTETTDSDSDGVGDNADWAPNDATETVDSDSDGVGDNADAFPNDASETLDSDGDGVGDNAQAIAEAKAAQQKAEDEKRRNQIIIVIASILIGIIGIGMFLKMRGRNSPDESKEYVSSIDSNASASQASSTPVQLQIVNQWTDDSGYTWRKMSDGSHHYWDGTKWIEHR